jgi:hypothetical protein
MTALLRIPSPCVFLRGAVIAQRLVRDQSCIAAKTAAVLFFGVADSLDSP